jgi:lipoprotein-anchoring transpeptidase ErfK/SrfK
LQAKYILARISNAGVYNIRIKMEGGLVMVKHFGGILMHNICLSIFVGLLLTTVATAWGSEAAAKKEIHVFIEEQILIAYENGEEVYNFDIVTGKDGKETTAGRYHIFRKHEKYTSKTYASEMPYTMFFTEDGKAIHGTQMATLRSYLHAYLTESVGSQGCVGLTDDNAKALFDWAPMGTPVVVKTNK